MKESANKLKMFFYATSFLTITCVILRTISFFTAYDSDIGYFSTEKFLPYLHKYLLITSAIFLVFALFLIKPKTLPCKLPKLSQVTTFSSMLCGLMYLCSSILLFVKIREGRTYLISIIIITAIIASLYYIAEAFSKETASISFKVATGLFTTINLISLILFENLDFTVQVNGPNKFIIIICFAIIPLFIIQELKFKIDRAQPKVYVFSALATMLVCASASIPGIIAHYGKVLDNSKYLLYYLITFAFSVYAFTKIQAYVSYTSHMADIENLEINTENEGEEIALQDNSEN